MKKYTFKQNDGFSLVELLVVIAIIATIIGLALPNYLGARNRARDARRKGEMSQLKTALQLYNGDYHVYPGSVMFQNGKSNMISGCGIGGTNICPSSCGVDFAAGPTTGCETTYMTKFPSELGTAMFYYSNGANYCLKDTLENASDGDLATSQSRCNATCTPLSGALGSTDFAVCSE